MKSIARRLAAAAALALCAATAAAETIGWIDINNAGATNPGTQITNAGHTAVKLTDLTAASLAGKDVVWVLNSSNSNYNALLTSALADLTAYVNAGGFLMVHDRFITGANAVIPGASGVSFTRSLSNDIQVLDNTTLVTNGPGGTVNNTNLDGLGSSNHGYATSASLPVGSTAILSRTAGTEVVDFTYALGSGGVYYSTIPLDFFLGSSNNLRNIYTPNVLAFATSFTPAVAPEPGTMALFGLGAAGLGALVWRRRRTRALPVA